MPLAATALYDDEMTEQSAHPPVTIYDVAKAAGVAPSTVSRTFARPGRVNADTAARVRAAAEQLGYRANPIGHAAGSRTRMLGVMVSDVANPFHATLIRGAQLSANAAGYELLLLDCRESGVRERTALERVVPVVEGFVIASSRMPDSALRSIAKQRPTVVLNRQMSDVACLVSDNVSGAGAALDLLAEQGHESVVYLSGPEASWAEGVRFRTVRDHGAALGIHTHKIGPYLPVFEGGLTAAEGAREAAHRGDRLQRPDGHRRDERLHPGRTAGAGTGEHHRVRRHPDGSAHPADADHGGGADPSDGSDGGEQCGGDDQRRQAAESRGTGAAGHPEDAWLDGGPPTVADVTGRPRPAGRTCARALTPRRGPTAATHGNLFRDRTEFGTITYMPRLHLHPERILPSDPTLRPIAREIHQSVQDLPIISPHGHVPAQWLSDDEPFGDPTSLLLDYYDHDVNRLLHADGVALSQLGRGQSDFLPNQSRPRSPCCVRIGTCPGHAVRFWLESELVEIFGIHRSVAETADDIYDASAAKLATPEFRPGPCTTGSASSSWPPPRPRCDHLAAPRQAGQ